jgi:hypothetical protein
VETKSKCKQTAFGLTASRSGFCCSHAVFAAQDADFCFINVGFLIAYLWEFRVFRKYISVF